MQHNKRNILNATVDFILPKGLMVHSYNCCVLRCKKYSQIFRCYLDTGWPPKMSLFFFGNIFQENNK